MNWKNNLDKHVFDKHVLKKHVLNKHGLDIHHCDKNGLEKHGLDKHGLDKHGLDKHDVDKHCLNKHGLDIKKIARSLGLTFNLVLTNHNLFHCADSGLGNRNQVVSQMSNATLLPFATKVDHLGNTFVNINLFHVYFLLYVLTFT